MAQVGILYDNISGNTGDIAIGLSIKKILYDLKIEFDELFPGNFNPFNYDTIIIGGGHLLRPSPDFFYDKFKIRGRHVLNAIGILDQVEDLHYLNEYKYLSVRSNGDRDKISYLNKEVSVVPCTTMLLHDLKDFSLNIERPSIGIHLFPGFLSKEDEIRFVNWANNLPFKVYFIPITHYIHDYRYLSELGQKIDSSAVLPVMNPLEILTVIGKFDYFITCSLHGAIFAYIHNIPFIIYNYNEKMRFFVEDRGLSNYCFTSFDQIKNLIETIAERPPDYSKNIETDMRILDDHVRHIKEALQGSLSVKHTYKKTSSDGWLFDNLKSSNYQINSLQMQIIDLFDRLNHHKVLIEGKEQQLANIDQQLRFKEQQLAFTQQQLADTQQQLASVVMQLKSRELYIREKEQQLASTQQQFSESEQYLAYLKEENESLKGQINTIQMQKAGLEHRLSLLQNQFLLMENSLGWRIIKKYRATMDRLFPLNSGRRKLYELTQKSMKTILIDGPSALVRKAAVRVEKKQEQEDDIGRDPLPKQQPKKDAIVINKEVDIADITVSVIIPTKNAGDGFRYLLSMLRSQKGIKHIEIILVDSGSLDNTLEIARQFDARIIEIRPEQFSHSYARNLGAENAVGEYILFTVQDALPPSDLWLYELYQALKNNDVVAVSCAEAPRDDADLFYRVIAWNHYRFLEVLDGDRILSKPASEDHIELRKNGQVSDIACLISRDIFLKYKYSGDYAEDLELGIKLTRDGYKLALLSSTKILHSHNRPAYYHLKRGYVDNLFLTRIFPDYSPGLTSVDKLLPDILFTYNALNSLIHTELYSLELPCRVKDINTIVTKALQSSLNAYYPIKIDVNNRYIDDSFALFLEKLSKNYKIDKSKITHDGILVYSVMNYASLIFEYMENIYDLIDTEIIEDFKSSLYKAFAIACGAQLACCYLCDSGAKNEIIEDIDRELRGGI